MTFSDRLCAKSEISFRFHFLVFLFFFIIFIHQPNGASGNQKLSSFDLVHEPSPTSLFSPPISPALAAYSSRAWPLGRAPSDPRMSTPSSGTKLFCPDWMALTKVYLICLRALLISISQIHFWEWPCHICSVQSQR